MPYRFFATSSIDALIHAVESSLFPKATPYTELFGYKAIEEIIRGYQVIAERGEEARKELLNQFLTASNFAGLAFGTAGCAAVHAMSYQLGGTFHVAHGEANYAVFIGVMKKYMEIRQDGKIQKLNHFLSELLGCSYEEGVHTVVNALAIVSGIVCDGAKASCAAKIASSVDAAILGYNMYKRGQEFRRGDGIVMQNIEETIRGIGRLGKDGMKETNEEIIKLMVGE